MRLQSLVIDNFKGIVHFEMDAEGQSADVFGDNATGKTTIADAMTWLLFDKDTDGRKAFSIKPMNADGDVRDHGAQTGVQGVFLDGTRTVCLEKNYREVWARKRGSTQSELTGHTTDYRIDGVPQTAKAYQAYIDRMVPSQLVPILSDPMYFPHALAWQKRREILLSLVDDVTDADVFASDPAFAVLADIGDMETYGKKLLADRRSANDELSKIPARLDELMRMLKDEPEDVDALRGRVSYLRRQIDTRKNPQMDGADAVRDAEQMLLAANGALAQYKADEADRMSAVRDSVRKTMIPLRDELERIQDEIRGKEREQTRMQMELELSRDTVEQLRAQFASASQSEWDGDEICPTCGQNMPDALIAESRARFEAERDARLEQINAQGAAVTDRIAKLEERITETDIDLIRMKKRRIDAEKKIASVYVQEEHGEGYEKKLDALRREVDAARDAVAQAKSLQSATRAQIADQIACAQAEVETLEQQIQIPQHNDTVRKRMEELNERQSTLADMLADIDKMTDTVERFTRAKCHMLQDRMNARFDTVKWRLWREQINGGLTDCCDALIDGVPFEDANNAAKINAGIEIIDQIAAHFGAQLPVLVDNAEAITQLRSTSLQTIRLIVSESDKTLRVEGREV